MSKHQRPRLSLRGDQPAPTTAPIEQAQAAPSAPIQEKTMEASQEKTQPEAPEATGPTAKQMAEVEAINAERARKAIEIQNAQIAVEEPSLIEVASRGFDALQEAFARHNANSKPKEYVPPPRTPRQMSQLEEELEAGRQAQQRAEAQKQAAAPPPVDANKEGFTTPVYRPGDVVPDPVLPAGLAAAGTRQFGPDAP